MSEYLSNIDLYYSPVLKSDGDIIELTGEEFHHAVNVMRKKEDAEIYITNGNGSIFNCVVNHIYKERLTAKIKEEEKYPNQLANISFCLPVLKNPDRFKFSLEKCTELGITNFIIFNSSRSVAKNKNIGKWNKIVLSAMKQSLRAFLPVITTIDNLNELNNYDGEKLIFDQSAVEKFKLSVLKNKQYYFIFGPEGGFSTEELSLFNKVFKLADNRLRTETAIIKCASIIS